MVCSLEQRQQHHWRKALASSQTVIFVNVESMNLMKVGIHGCSPPPSLVMVENHVYRLPQPHPLSLTLLSHEGRSGATVLCRAKLASEEITLQPEGLHQDQFAQLCKESVHTTLVKYTCYDSILFLFHLIES